MSLWCQGFLKLSVWLRLDPSTCPAGLRHTGNGHAEEQRRPAATAGEADRLSPQGRAGGAAELMGVGQVEIMDEATLEDLKTQVSTYQPVFPHFI